MQVWQLQEPFCNSYLLDSLNFTVESEDLLFWYKQQKKRFLWTMAAAQAAENHRDGWGLTDTYNEGYIHQFQPKPTHRIH